VRHLQHLEKCDKMVYNKSEGHPKMESIGEYWDDKTMIEIEALLWEYKDLFPKIFSKFKGIKGDLGEMRI
jgi:hypothetical protein